MDRPGIHDLPKSRVRTKLRALGLQVDGVSPLERYDFIVNDSIRVALRTAFPSSYRRRVRLRKRVYSYVYRAWNFNFHHRGQITERYCDFFICVPMGAKKLSLDAVYVIPWEARTGKTFYLPDSERPYAGKYSPYRGAWRLLVSSPASTSRRRTAAPAVRVRAASKTRGGKEKGSPRAGSSRLAARVRKS